jgi:hypothetical protein
MSDEGCIERNVQVNQIALDRARIRNGNNGDIPDYAHSSVTGVDIGASQAVNGPRNPIKGGE